MQTATSHLSIGEVLDLLQDGFPDITISKIRFLESQGLIDPERTPSGYRKFYASDIERLRWILTQQREHYLPLKVIKDRLAEGAVGDDDETEPVAEDETVTDPSDGAGDPPTEADGDHRPVPEPSGVTAEASEHSPEPETRPEGKAASQPIWMADLARARASAPLDAPAPPLRLDGGPTEVHLTATELTAAAGVSPETLEELVRFGLVAGRSLGDDIYFDGDALLIATKAAAFIAHGIGARHLRMFKVAADREAGFLEQVAMPLLKQRNPDARRQAVETVEELSALGHDLRAALLRSQLRHHLDQA